MKPRFSFWVGVETDDQTGETLSVYLRIRKGKSKTVKEYADGAAFADYDRRGELLGIEVLAPCEAKILNKIAKDDPAKRFIKRSIPMGMMVPA